MTISDEEKILINRMLELLKIVDEWMERDAPTPQAGSALAGDDARTDPYQLSHAVIRSLAIAIDHLHSLRMALTSGPSDINVHSYAPFTQTRAALENASTALWILQPAGRKERILRRLLRESMSTANAESLLSDTSAGLDSSIHRRKQRILDVADGVGIAHEQLAKRHRPTYTDIVKEAGIYTELNDSDANYVYLMWRLCSAVAHGDGWITSFFDLEVLGPITPGVSAVRITAPTPLLMAGIQAAMVVINRTQHLLTERATFHR